VTPSRAAGWWSGRFADAHDGTALQAIYAPVVAERAISFEWESPSAEEMADRVLATLPEHPWLAGLPCDAEPWHANGGDAATGTALRAVGRALEQSG
jgi:hypothetical protein